ncbi:aminotransferase class IV [Streptomyces sp. NPDC097640]|uniref:aminotransferase class IV n=1 Tax=Streptomyces sp. NPDC097640 TaxID=3157229 RepID=UPI003324A8DD
MKEHVRMEMAVVWQVGQDAGSEPDIRALMWCEDRGLTPCRPVPDTALLAADSWLVDEGRVRGLERHRHRFVTACAEATGDSPARIERFWQEAVDALPRAGAWFPRVELAGPEPARLFLRIRPAPPRTGSVAVWVDEEADPRTLPRRKGPDLSLLAELRGRATGRGAQDLMLTTPDGLVLEGTTANVLWWEGDVLCRPSTELPLLAGVTTALIEERATRLEVAVEHRRPTAADLDGREVWFVNALHGIRPVTEWLGSPLRAGPARHAASWQSWLDTVAEPLPTTNGDFR